VISLKLIVSLENEKFLQRIMELSGENVSLCFQCGECTSSCPLSHEMDILPSTMMRFIQLGQTEVLESKMMWTCSSCFNCSARCPVEIDVAKVIEALRQINLRNVRKGKGDYFNLKEIPKEEIRRLPQMAITANIRKFSA
jgi:heterodisulfide reductase subunit C